jgi:hypothetical protein
VDQLLSEFYSDNSLRVVDLPFDVGSNQAAAKWNDGITELVTGLPGYKACGRFYYNAYRS